MGVARGVGRTLAESSGLDRLLPSAQAIEGACMVIVDVPILRIRRRGSLVPPQSLLVVSACGMFLGDAVESEGVVGLQFEQRHELV